MDDLAGSLWTTQHSLGMTYTDHETPRCGDYLIRGEGIESLTHRFKRCGGATMASITFRELQQVLLRQNQQDVFESVEIVFSLPGYHTSVIDEEMKDHVITADCPFGSVTIMFDQFGLLKSVEVN